MEIKKRRERAQSTLLIRLSVLLAHVLISNFVLQEGEGKGGEKGDIKREILNYECRAALSSKLGVVLAGSQEGRKREL